MAAIWDSVVATASKAAAQAGETTQVVATKAKLHADLLVIDRDIHARKEKFGVEMYAHLQGITSTQEFYVADDRLINIIRPTLIKAQREVAAYERKRDAMRGKVNLVEAERCGTGSIFYAATISEKLYNAAKFAAAGAREAASKTELAMIERQILGFKEEFGVEMYPIFESMEDNEGWLPTDRKVRSLYDCAREDIAKMKKMQQEKREQILRLDGVEGSGSASTTVPPTSSLSNAAMSATSSSNIHATVGIGQTTTTMPSWTSNALPSAVAVPVGNGYGSTAQPSQKSQPSYAAYEHQPRQQPNPSHDSGFGFLQSSQPSTSNSAMQSSMSQYSSNSTQQQQYPQQPIPATSHPLQSVFDPFDGIAGPSVSMTSSSSSAYAPTAYAPSTAPVNASLPAYDPNSMTYNNAPQRGSGGSLALSDADMNLFKF